MYGEVRTVQFIKIKHYGNLIKEQRRNAKSSYMSF